jgi:hypothetical protein
MLSLHKGGATGSMSGSQALCPLTLAWAKRQDFRQALHDTSKCMPTDLEVKMSCLFDKFDTD